MHDATPPPLFDPGPFEELREVGGPDLIQELTELFLADTPELLDQLEQAAAAGDWESMGRAAHSLKSSAFYLGALAMSDLARRIEQATQEGCPEEGLALVDEPRRSFGPTSEALRSACASLPPGA